MRARVNVLNENFLAFNASNTTTHLNKMCQMLNNLTFNRAFALGVPNAKYLAFGTTKKPLP